MKLAVTSTGETLDSQVEARFGRCGHFLVIDTETMEVDSIANPNLALGGGAGIQSAQLLAGRGVGVVLTGNCGPNAFQVFGQAGIRVIVGVSGSVRQAVEAYQSGSLTAASGPSVASHFGMGGAAGAGRGMGRGMGRGQAMAGQAPMPSVGEPPVTPVREVAALKEQARMLEQEKQQLDQRIQELESGSSGQDSDR